MNKLLQNDSKECIHYTNSQIKSIKITPRPNERKIDQLLQISKIEECLQNLVKIVGCEKLVLVRNVVIITYAPNKFNFS